MRQIAIYNTFDSEELLEGSINCLRDHVDFVLVVAQTVSNFGEHYSGGYELAKKLKIVDDVILYEPNLLPDWNSGSANETAKRNLGIEYAKQHGFTHFLNIDNDEYYEDFGKAKQQYIDSGAKGSVVKMFTYFKHPALRFEHPDNYYVPFIFELNSNTFVGDNDIGFVCDPTRKPNEKDVIVIGEKMHHFSWIRNDIIRKVNNSSARGNITSALEDYNNSNCKEGYFVSHFGQKLIKVPNRFNI